MTADDWLSVQTSFPKTVTTVGRCRLTVSNPVLKAVWFQRLKVNYHQLFSTVAFNIILRRYTMVPNTGTEAPGYFAHLSEHYETLAPYTAFIHGRVVQLTPGLTALDLSA